MNKEICRLCEHYANLYIEGATTFLSVRKGYCERNEKIVDFVFSCDNWTAVPKDKYTLDTEKLNYAIDCVKYLMKYFSVSEK